MNLIVVDKCTNDCPYCFASSEMAKKGGLTALSREGIEAVVRFAHASGPNYDVNVIGGEPFLYHDLGYLLERLCGESAVGSVTVFTGGIFATRALDSAAVQTRRVALLVNLNERRDYRHPRDYDVVLRNVSHALALGVRVTFGFNIWREDFDHEEILAACARFGVEHLRWTIAYPESNPMPGVRVLAPEAYKRVARRVAEFLEAAYRRGVRAHVDCPLPKCFFTPAELGRILLTQPQSAIPVQACGPVIDVAPDLTVFRCYALSGGPRRNLTEFATHADAVAWFQAAVDDRFDRPTVFDACATCEFADNRTCYGGCLGHTPKGLGRRPTDSLRFAHAAVKEGRWVDADAALEALPRPRADAAAALLHSYVASGRGDGETALRWARVAVNRSRAESTRTVAAVRVRDLAPEYSNADANCPAFEPAQLTSAPLAPST